MGKSLNDYASRVAQIIGQPDNISIRERIKDSIKDYFAKYIVQSIDKNGINETYKITLAVELERLEKGKVDVDENTTIYTNYKSKYPIPTPMNIKNDAPFTRVSDTNNYNYSYRTSGVFAKNTPSAFPPPYQLSKQYSLKNKILLVYRPYLDKPNVENTNITSIDVEGIWENPEEVLGYYSIDDNQDLELPFPNEMMNRVLLDLLKTEFNIVPKDTEIEKM